MSLVVVCFRGDEIIHKMFLGGFQSVTKEYIEKRIPKNCTHYDVVNGKQYDIYYKETNKL